MRSFCLLKAHAGVDKLQCSVEVIDGSTTSAERRGQNQLTARQRKESLLPLPVLYPIDPCFEKFGRSGHRNPFGSPFLYVAPQTVDDHLNLKPVGKTKAAKYVRQRAYGRAHIIFVGVRVLHCR